MPGTGGKGQQVMARFSRFVGRYCRVRSAIFSAFCCLVVLAGSSLRGSGLEKSWGDQRQLYTIDECLDFPEPQTYWLWSVLVNVGFAYNSTGQSLILPV